MLNLVMCQEADKTLGKVIVRPEIVFATTADNDMFKYVGKVDPVETLCFGNSSARQFQGLQENSFREKYGQMSHKILTDNFNFNFSLFRA